MCAPVLLGLQFYIIDSHKANINFANIYESVKSMRRLRNVLTSSIVSDISPSARASVFLESVVNTDMISRTRENFALTEAEDADRESKVLIARMHSSNLSAPAKLNVHYNEKFNFCCRKKISD